MQQWTIAAAAGIATLCLFASFQGTIVPAFRFVVGYRRGYYASSLEKLHDDESDPNVYVLGEVLLGLGVAGFVYLIFKTPFLSILAFPAGFFIPTILIVKKVQQQFMMFEQQLPDALISISSSVRAGLSLPQAIATNAKDLPSPVRDEFALISKQYDAGLPLDDALTRAARAIGSRNFSLVASALIINRERGGDISDILERLSASLREVFRLEEKIRTETAGARFEGRVMLAVPPFILFMLFMAEPDLVNALFASPIGIVMVLFAVSLMVVAFFWIQKILNKDV